MAFKDMRAELYRGTRTEPRLASSWPGKAGASKSAGRRPDGYAETVERGASMLGLKRGILIANEDEAARRIAKRPVPRVKLTCEPSGRRGEPYVPPAPFPPVKDVQGAVDRLRGVGKAGAIGKAADLDGREVCGLIPECPEWTGFKKLRTYRD